MPLLQLELFKRGIYKNLEHLSKKHIFVSIPNVGVEHFWVDGEHVFAYSQYTSSRYMWSVLDLDQECGNMTLGIHKTRHGPHHQRWPSSQDQGVHGVHRKILYSTKYDTFLVTLPL